MTMKVNKEKLYERAKESFANVTELADTLVRKSDLSFRQAHEIVSSSVKDFIAQGYNTLDDFTLVQLNKHDMDVVGYRLDLIEKQSMETLDPEHLFNIRSLK